jgi:hypothetical protein
MQAVSHPADRKLGGMAQAIYDIQEPEVGAVFNVGVPEEDPQPSVTKLVFLFQLEGMSWSL